MKQVIGIYVTTVGAERYWDENTQGLGGSETWANELAAEFQRRNFHVIIFGNPQNWHFSSVGVEYVPSWLFHSRSEYQHYDYFIFSRSIGQLAADLNCPHIYVMSHECSLLDNGNIIANTMNKIQKISCLSIWHKDAFLTAHPGVEDNRIFLTANGVNQELYQRENIVKENAMVWSSCKERGLQHFLQRIYPEIRKYVPDFKLYVCGYNDDLTQGELPEGVTYCGRLNKAELATLQKKCKVWVYPNYGWMENGMGVIYETFCISAIENALAGNALVCSDASGLRTTLNGYPYFAQYNTSATQISDEKIESLDRALIEQAVRALSDESYRNKMVESAYGICEKYTWQYVADLWLKEWGIKR